MSYTKTDFQNFLSLQWPFDRLPLAVQERLAEQLRPLRYRMGQPILVRDKMPSQVALLYEGRARLLGYNPVDKKPATLELVASGGFLGWASLTRGVACETAIAASESILLTLPAETFRELCRDNPGFRRAFTERCSMAEAFDLLGKELERQPRGGIDLRSVTQSALEDAAVVSVPPGRTNVATLADDHPLRQSGRLWLVASEGSSEREVGEPLDLQALQALEVSGDRPLRVIGFRRQDLPWLPDYVSSSPAAENGSSIAKAAERNGVESSASDTIPYAERLVVSDGGEIDVSDGRRRAQQAKFPHVRGKTPLDSALACFQMLAQHFQIPFRREVIHRVLKDQIARSGTISLPVAGAISELMGLKAQLVNIPAKAVPRLNPPALLRWQDGLAVLYDARDRELTLGVPESGIVRRTPQAFGEVWGEGGQVLLLEKTKETPQQRFGLQWFLPSVKRYSGVLILVFIASFFVQLFALANPLMIQVIIDKVIVQGSLPTLNILGGFLLAIAVFEAVLTALRTYLFVDTTNRIDMALGSEIIDHLLRLPLRYFEKRPVGELSSRINELERIRQFLTGTALTVVLDSVFSVVYILVMLLYSWKLTLASLASVPFFVALTLVFSPVIRRQLRQKAERNAHTQAHLVEVMTGIQTVKAQNIELRARWRWQERYARYVSAGFQNVITSTIASASSNFLNKISGLVVLWFGAALVLGGELTLGQLIAFRIIAGYVTSPLLRLAQLWQNFQETALSLERLSDIVDTPQEAEQDRDNIPMPLVSGRVKYENVTFRFKRSGPLQLNGVDLEVEPGTFVGVVGQSGAGKSTLTKLLARLYEPEGGRILVDDYDISKVEMYSLRRQIGVVPQETLLFEGSVQENIALTNPDATTDEIIEAAKAAAAHEFIMDLPAGYNTRVGERGASLSGGQRQRIAIARTVLQRPRLLILDEATSALDYATEQQVSQNLARVFADRTVFFITHRLATIKHSADTILMMDAGRIVEQGTHAELMSLKGHYFYLYQQQEAQL